jgi:hypothetical protein
MTLNRYKSLLSEVASQLSDLGDANGERLFLRWLRAADGLQDSSGPNLVIKTQLAEVQRSAKAITILAAARYFSPMALDRSGQANLESAVDELLCETAGLLRAIDTADKVLADRGLPETINEFLSSVEFVMDYVQLRFCGSTLTALASPEVREDGLVYRINEPGYRDALCRRIGVVVREVEIHEAEELAIHFVDGGSIRVSLREEDGLGPENAIYSSKADGLWVW